MKIKIRLLSFIIFVLSLRIFEAGATDAQSPGPDQQISDFSVAGFGEKGKKTWDLSGKSADIVADTIKLNDITGNMYGDKEDIKLTSDTGDFDKANGKVHLEDNVVITTSSGAQLTTDSLDWDRKNEVVSTNDKVNIEKENMTVVADGARGHPNLNTLSFEKDVQVELKQKEAGSTEEALKNKVVITCDGSLDIDYKKNVAVFNKNVKVDRDGSQIYSDIIEVYFITDKKEKRDKDVDSPFMGSDIDKIVAKGNVKIVRGENVSYSDEAVYTAADRKISLIGRPKLVIYSAEDLKDAPFGN
jgi:LPS export ABC transporter protein LptC